MTAIKLARSIAILMSIFIAACRNESPSDPVCRIDSEQLDNISADAKCVVRVDDFLLTIKKGRSNKLELPGGENQNEESAQCTAHRETWELTGFNVEVGSYLGSDKDDTRYYSCMLDAGFDGQIKAFPVPEWAIDDTSEIQLVDPFSTTDKSWNVPEKLVFIRDMFNKTNK